MDYMDMLVTRTLNYNFEKAKISHVTHDRVEMLGKAKFLPPSQKEMAVQLAILQARYRGICPNLKISRRNVARVSLNERTAKVYQCLLFFTDMAGGIAPRR